MLNFLALSWGEMFPLLGMCLEPNRHLDSHMTDTEPNKCRLISMLLFHSGMTLVFVTCGQVRLLHTVNPLGEILVLYHKLITS